MSLTDQQLFDNFFFLCLVYASNNGGVSDIDTFSSQITLNDDGSGNIRITKWTHPSPQPTNAQLKSLTLASLTPFKIRHAFQKRIIIVPKLATTTINALGVVPDGALVFDTTLLKLRVYDSATATWI